MLYHGFFLPLAKGFPPNQLLAKEYQMPIVKIEHDKAPDPRKIYYYGGSFSNNCMRVTLHLQEKGLEWTRLVVNVPGAGNLKPEYLRVHPKGTVPAIIHNGLAVSDSNDILKYIEEKFPSPSLLTSDPNKTHEMWGHVDRAANIHPKMVKAYFYSQGMGRPCSAKSLERYREVNKELYDFHVRYGKKMSGEQVAEVIAFNHATIQELENILEDQPWLCGDSYSLADIAWVANLFFLEAIKFDLSSYPKVKGWMNRIRERPAYNKKTKIPSIPLWLLRFMSFVLRLKMK